MIFYEKLAEKKQEQQERTPKSDIAKMLGAAYLGNKLINHGAERVLGVQRFTHGTSDAAAKAILQEGMLAEHGGKGHGSSAQLGGRMGEAFARRSRGRVHIFKDTPFHRRLAAGHANLAETGKGQSDMGKAIVGLKGGGTRIYGAMPYDRVAGDFELDPDYGGQAFRSKLDAVGDITPEHLSASRFGLRGIIANRTSDIGGYIKNNKGRFARGIGLLGTGLGTVGYAGSKAKDLYNQYQDDNDPEVHSLRA
jgi:hypothetical protein